MWPGEVLKPPEGVPERGFLTVTFLEVSNLQSSSHIKYQSEELNKK